jgi:hypothetical protein
MYSSDGRTDGRTSCWRLANQSLGRRSYFDRKAADTGRNTISTLHRVLIRNP